MMVVTTIYVTRHGVKLLPLYPPYAANAVDSSVATGQ